MKKLLIAICMLLGIVTISNAQTTTTAKQTKPKTTKTTKTTTAGPVKKDGTPDMRYKANKNAAKPAGPLKKDGTPDMRYKANKKPVVTPKS